MGSSKMTDAERDQIDADAEKFIKTCSDAIKSFKDQGEYFVATIQNLSERNCQTFAFERKSRCYEHVEQVAVI